MTSDTPIVPLNRTTPRPYQLGGAGTNRAPIDGLQIAAESDLDALRAFLGEYDKSPGTYRIYERECERLFLWAWHERDQAVSSLTRQDFETYLDFLANPQPASRWCGPKAGRDTERWRPFVGPLGLEAVKTAVSAVNSMMAYWVDAGYIQGNPMGLIRQRSKKMRAQAPAPGQPWDLGADAKVERFLDSQMWMAVTQAVEAMPQDTDRQLNEKERLRFICAFMYLLAPRAGEMENQRMNSFREERGHWWWYVWGKGDKPARIPLPDDMIQALVRYRKHLKKPAAPSPKDDSPLLISVRDGHAITARRLNQILKTLFAAAAELLPPDAEHKKEKLRTASAHWGRHTGITARVDAGMDQRYVTKDARHADARTTARYVHEEDERWHEETQKLRLPRAESTGEIQPGTDTEKTAEPVQSVS